VPRARGWMDQRGCVYSVGQTSLDQLVTYISPAFGTSALRTEYSATRVLGQDFTGEGFSVDDAYLHFYTNDGRWGTWSGTSTAIGKLNSRT
jgi:hypothetical protein